MKMKRHIVYRSDVVFPSQPHLTGIPGSPA